MMGIFPFIKKIRTIFWRDSLLYAEMNLHLGKSYYQLNRFKETISHLESQQPSSRNHFYNEFQFLLGISYSRIHEWQHAIQTLTLVNQYHSDADKVIAGNLIRSLQNFPDLPEKFVFSWRVVSDNPRIRLFLLPSPGNGYCFSFN